MCYGEIYRQGHEVQGLPDFTSFIDVINVFAHTSEGIMEVNRKVLLDLGFSTYDMMKFLRQTPLLFSSSMEKTKRVVELLLATGKYCITNIVANPMKLMCSIEKRLVSRCKLWDSRKVGILLKSGPVFQEFLHLRMISFLTHLVNLITF